MIVHINYYNKRFDLKSRKNLKCHVMALEFASRSFKGKQNAQYQFQLQMTIITFKCLFLKYCPVLCS